MHNIESVVAEGHAVAQRISNWSDAVSRVFTQLDVTPTHPGNFRAQLQYLNIGARSLAEVISAPSEVEHTKLRERRMNEQVLLVHLQMQGESANRQCGREALLRAGDFTLCDSARPYSLRFDSFNDMLVLRIPIADLRARLVQPEQFTARRIAGDEGAGAIASMALQQLWRQCLHGLDPLIAERLLDNCIDLLATAISANDPQGVAQCSLRNAMFLRVRYYIAGHLTDPALGAAQIAAALKISPRYVHRLFEGGEESLGQYVLRRRLERCAELLRDPAQSARSVTRIAFTFAFNDASWFSRSFRRRFGVTPSEYRAQSC